MSATEAAKLDVNALIPDGIEPLEAWRCWTLEARKLRSLNGGGVHVVWTPGEPMTAVCNAQPEQYVWSFAPRGMTLDEARQRAESHNRNEMLWRLPYGTTPARVAACMPVPSVQPPDGMGYHADLVVHDAPYERCTCGVYAATTADNVPLTGNVYGKVKLWGKIIPGDKGYRAQYAYPSEFHVSATLANDRTLKAFGVPIIVTNMESPQGANAAMTFPPINGSVVAVAPRPTRGMDWRIKAALALNLGAVALNIATAYGHLYK